MSQITTIVTMAVAIKCLPKRSLKEFGKELASKLRTKTGFCSVYWDQGLEYQ
jgi:hypothetical protein